MSIRTRILELSPPWLVGRVGERFLYNLGLELDLLVERAAQAVRMRMPTECDATALGEIGRDRLFPQGFTEPDDEYRLRLQFAHDEWQRAGTSWSVLRQALFVLRALQPAIRVVSNRYTDDTFPWTIERSTWDAYAAEDDPDEQPTRTAVFSPSGNWDWDSLNIRHGSWNWARFWVVIESVGANAWCGPAPWTIGDPSMPAVGDRSWSIGFDCPAETIESVFGQILRVKPGNAECTCLIVSFDETLFDPDEPAGGGINPDGYFGEWTKLDGEDQVFARTITDARYCHRTQ